MTIEDFVTTCYGLNFVWKSHYTPKQELSVGGGGGYKKSHSLTMMIWVVQMHVTADTLRA